ncbi:carboxypeptidase regulatory-like domain-containing protein, partial [bacterium]|nr:carboxypeptidase regulatory-like domain-containing protein [bacterium]
MKNIIVLFFVLNFVGVLFGQLGQDNHIQIKDYQRSQLEDPDVYAVDNFVFSVWRSVDGHNTYIEGNIYNKTTGSRIRGLSIVDERGLSLSDLGRPRIAAINYSSYGVYWVVVYSYKKTIRARVYKNDGEFIYQKTLYDEGLYGNNPKFSEIGVCGNENFFIVFMQEEQGLGDSYDIAGLKFDPLKNGIGAVTKDFKISGASSEPIINKYSADDYGSFCLIWREFDQDFNSDLGDYTIYRKEIEFTEKWSNDENELQYDLSKSYKLHEEKRALNEFHESYFFRAFIDGNTNQWLIACQDKSLGVEFMKLYACKGDIVNKVGSPSIDYHEFSPVVSQLYVNDPLDDINIFVSVHAMKPVSGGDDYKLMVKEYAVYTNNCNIQVIKSSVIDLGRSANFINGFRVDSRSGDEFIFIHDYYPVNNQLELYSYTYVGPEISGHVRKSNNEGVGGVTISFSNDGGSTTTEDDGSYSIPIQYKWHGRATPYKNGYEFNPQFIDYNIVKHDDPDENYTGTSSSPVISGYVQTSGGSAISNVAITFSDNNVGNTTTNSSGYYSKTVPYNWDGTVTPSKSGYSFSPSNK